MHKRVLRALIEESPLTRGGKEILYSAAPRARIMKGVDLPADALNPTRAVVEEGVVPGGGVAYLRAMRAQDKAPMEEDEPLGVNLSRKALEEPVRQIANNAGFEGAVVVRHVLEGEGLSGSTPRPACTKTFSKAALWTPPKSHAVPFKMPLP